MLNRPLLVNVQIFKFLDSYGHACSLQEGTNSYTSILWRRQRQGWRLIDAPSVVRPATTGATWENTWKISTSQEHSPTLANTARPRWLPKLSPPEQNYKIMSPLFTSLFRSVLLTEVWTFQDLGTVSQIQKNYFNLCRKMKTRTQANISGYAPSVARGSSAELLWGTTVNRSILRACSSTTATYARRRCLLKVPSTITWLFITTRQRCWVAPNTSRQIRPFVTSHICCRTREVIWGLWSVCFEGDRSKWILLPDLPGV